MTYQELFDIINDNTARPDEVDDAVMDLGDYPEEEVVVFLVAVAGRPLPDIILSSVGESLGHIFAEDVRLYQQYKPVLLTCPTLVQKEVLGVLKEVI